MRIFAYVTPPFCFKKAKIDFCRTKEKSLIFYPMRQATIVPRRILTFLTKSVYRILSNDETGIYFCVF